MTGAPSDSERAINDERVDLMRQLEALAKRIADQAEANVRDAKRLADEARRRAAEVASLREKEVNGK